MQAEGWNPTFDTRVRHDGVGLALLLIIVVNWILRLLTLGIYHFWAKTRVRLYIWNRTSFDGQPFEYTGRGLELLLGFVYAVILIAALGVATRVLSSALVPFGPWISAAPDALFGLAVFFLACMGVYGARRYTLSRTGWGGIAFAQTGSSVRYAGLTLGQGFLAVITLGLYMPFLRDRLLLYRAAHTWYGSARFAYDGRGSDLFPRFLLSYVLTLPTLGLIWVWYAAAEARYRAHHTRLRGVTFSIEYTGLQLLLHHLGNLLILLLTLGLGYPWFVVRRIRFLFRHLRVRGEVDYASITEAPRFSPPTGEGLVELLDVGSGLLGLPGI